MDDFLSEIEYNRLDELLDTVCGSLSEEDQQFLRRRIKPLRRRQRDQSSSSSSSSTMATTTTTATQDDVVRAAPDGRDLGTVLRRSGACDETQLGPLLDGLKCLRRYDLLRIAYSHERKAVKTDPLEEFLIQEASKINNNDVTSSSSLNSHGSCSGKRSSLTQEPTSHGGEENHDASPQRKKRRTRSSRNNNTNNNNNNAAGSNSSAGSSDSYYSQSASTSDSATCTANTRQTPSPSQNDVGVRQRQTCDVRLRVWAEYCDHERVLRESVFSQKADAHERQLERFSQASAVLRSRDLGYIVCDIKFSEITYLDAFWRDYLNGSLLEALKGVFITESLKQAVGNEPIKLLVSIDEEDYEEGRHILMNNVYLDHGRRHE